MVFEIQFFRLEAARRAYLNKKMEQSMLVSWFLHRSKNTRHNTHCSSFESLESFLELRLFKENVEYLEKKSSL